MSTLYAEVPRFSWTGLRLSGPAWLAQAYGRRHGPLILHLGGLSYPAGRADLRLVRNPDAAANAAGSMGADAATGVDNLRAEEAEAQAYFPAVATWPKSFIPSVGVTAAPPADEDAVVIRFPGRGRLRGREHQNILRKPSVALGRAARVAAIASAVSAVAVAAVPITASVRARSVWADIARANADASLAEVHDRSGRIIAYQRSGSGKSERKFRPMRQAPPAAFIDILTHLEDRYTGAWYHVLGMDLRGLGRAVWCRAKDRTKPDCGGGSTLVHQLVSGSHGRIGGQSASEKWNEIVDGWSVSLRFDLNDPKTTQLLADSAPYATVIDPNAGGDIWGLELGSRVLFGVEPTRLSVAQQALLAASIRSPLILSCRTLKPKWQDAQLRRWNKARDRAIFGLNGLDPARVDVASVRHELETMAPITRPVSLDTDLVAGLSRREACEAAANPLRRGGLVWNWGLNAAAQERVDAPTTGINDMMVGYDAADQAGFARRAQRALGTIEERSGKKLAWRLTGNDRLAGILLVVVDRDGVVRRFYNSGPLLRFDTPRNPGSMGKLIVAAAAAGDGNMPAQLCDLRDRSTGVKNADGSIGFETCGSPAMRSVEETFGRSLNLPALNLARGLNPSALDRSAAASGASWPDNMSKPNALVLGRVGITPRQMLGNLLALQHGVAGGSATSPLPRVTISPIGTRPIIDLGFAFRTNAGRTFMKTVAQAALTHPRGTIRTTPALPLRPNEIAKSGTVDGPGDRAVLKWVSGATEDGAYIAVIAAPSGVLGDGLSISPLTQMLRAELGSTTPVPARPAARPAP